MKNSEVLQVLICFASDGRSSWRIVELAGKGIAASAAFTQWTIEVGKPSLDGEYLADILMDFGEVEDAVIELWNSFECGDLSRTAAEIELRGLISRMEEFTSK